MGTFQEALIKAQPDRMSGKRTMVLRALRERGDGSEEEFLAVMANYDIPARAISRAIETTIGIKVSESMVLRWRASEWPNS